MCHDRIAHECPTSAAPPPQPNKPNQTKQTKPEQTQAKPSKFKQNLAKTSNNTTKHYQVLPNTKHNQAKHHRAPSSTIKHYQTIPCTCVCGSDCASPCWINSRFLRFGRIIAGSVFSCAILHMLFTWPCDCLISKGPRLRLTKYVDDFPIGYKGVNHMVIQVSKDEEGMEGKSVVLVSNVTRTNLGHLLFWV